MDNLLSELNEKFEKLQSSDFLCFDDVGKLKDVMGVYIIFNEKKELIYVGKTNKFHVRIGTDLTHESTHTLVKKLIGLGGLPDRFRVKDYLIDKCSMKIERCDNNRQAEALEHLAI